MCSAYPVTRPATAVTGERSRSPAGTSGGRAAGVALLGESPGREGVGEQRVRRVVYGEPICTGVQRLYGERLATLPGVQRLTSTLVMKHVVKDRPLPA